MRPQADDGELGSRDLVRSLINDEREHRDTTRIARLERVAKFEEAGTLEDFDYDYSPERRKVAARIRDLTQMRWHSAGEPILLTGSTGVGKTRVATGLGRLAIRLGTACGSPRPTACCDTWPAATKRAPGNGA